MQRSATKSSTPMTTELFLQWKREKQAQKEAELSEKKAERAKNDRMRYADSSNIESNFSVFLHKQMTLSHPVDCNAVSGYLSLPCKMKCLAVEIYTVVTDIKGFLPVESH